MNGAAIARRPAAARMDAGDAAPTVPAPGREERGSRRSLAWSWAPAGLWAALIFLLSTETFSAERIARRLKALASSSGFGDRIHPIVEIGPAAVHALEYFVLVCLVAHAIRAGRPGSGARAAVYAFLAALVYAGADEAHQAFVTGRTAAVGDWVFDVLGAGLATLWLIPSGRTPAGPKRTTKRKSR